jgi:two-component system chemotaxis response regulator CheY
MVTFRDVIKGIMIGLGYSQIDTAVDGKDGYSKAKIAETAPYSLIFTDINMPNANGIQFIQGVRKLPMYKKTPIIVISSENESMIVIEAIAAGASNYILKPFTAEKIANKIIEVFSKLQVNK